MNRQEAIAKWQDVREELAEKGVFFPGAQMFVPDEFRPSGEVSLNQLAMDAAGNLTTDPNSAIPSFLTSSIDPNVIEVIFAPLQIAKILGGDVISGNWTEQTRYFPVAEDVGEVSSYDDFATSGGRIFINYNYPQLQSYLYQTIVQYGELETERAGLMRINYVSGLQKAAAGMLNRFGNLAYAFGLVGLQNYGLLNNPYLSAYLTPTVKAWGGTSWFSNGSPAATANEVYNDIFAVFEQIINQTNGVVDKDTPCTLAMSPQSMMALEFANSFGVFVADLLKRGFPNMKIMSAPQYGQKTTTNSQGYSTIGNAFQIIINEIDGQRTAYPAYNEKLRAHKLIGDLSSFKQKYTSGVWGTVTRMPMAIAGMLGV